MLEMNRELVEAASHESVNILMQAARQHMRGKTLLDHALEQMKQGTTTVAEVMRW
jgi:type II secretory ATPase GspE/PulE/Tfp pilus assembly ATPase PilB-like protein